MQANKNGVSRRGMFISSKLGQNLSEMEVRTLIRIQKVIWYKLLASKAEIIEVSFIFVFCVESHTMKYYTEYYQLVLVLLWCLPLSFCSPPRPFLRLSQLRKVRKRCFSFSSQAIIQNFSTEMSVYVMIVFSG